MKNKAILTLLAVVPLFVWSCAKTGFDPEEVESPLGMPDPWTAVPKKVVPGTGGHASVVAGNVDTKSQVQIVSGSSAKVVWSDGDAFYMFGHNTGAGTIEYAEYTAATGGDIATFSTANAPSEGMNDYYAFYPSSGFHAWDMDDDGKIVVGWTIPINQVAAPGKVAEGANLSFAKPTSPSQTENLTFTNAVSFIKFRLSGSIVNQIKKVSFVGTDELAGDFIFQPNGNVLELWPGVHFIDNYGNYLDDVSCSASLSLEGGAAFAVDTDYFIAVAPSVHSGFSMVFSDGAGTPKTITKFSSKALTLNRSQIKDFGTISLGDSFDEEAVAELYKEHTTSQYATIAVVPDGYTKAELPQYVTDAHAAIDALFNTEPYKTYASYFNVWILKVPSNESGARYSDSEEEALKYRDCYFQSSWPTSKYTNMRANDNRIFSFVENYCPDITGGVHTIDEVPVLVLINDTRYGGVAWNYASGRAYGMVPKAYGGGDLTWSYPAYEATSVTQAPPEPFSLEALHQVTDGEKTALGSPNVGTWRNTVVHEFGGHCIGKLGDEYWYADSDTPYTTKMTIGGHTWTVPMSLNLSTTYDKASVEWHDFFKGDGSLIDALNVAPYNARIGVFQGGEVSTYNRWRSEKISCMIDNRFYFSTWQRYLIVNRIMSLAGLAEVDIATFLASDVPTDPNRDGGSGVMLPMGVSNRVPPRPVPMLPPPGLVQDR